MAEVRCPVCGEVVPPSALTRGGSGAGDAGPLCPACRGRAEALAALDGASDGTAVVPPAMVAEAVEEDPQAALVTQRQDPPAPAVEARPDAPEREVKGPAAGRVFGNYQILEEISRGSFGVVYRARQKGLDRIVALKVLLAGPHASPEMVSRFQREARAAAKLKHPCIVPIYDIGSEEGHHYFAMEFIEGDPLSLRIARNAVSIPEALAIAEHLADAIQVAHSQGVVHRDLKPSNILVDAEGLPHITDFGLAKQVDLDTRYTQAGTTLGTPAYMPPEQARGEVDRVDARSDVYSLGAVLYEMLTGRAPFSGRSLLEVVVAVLNEPVRPPRQVNPKIHPDVQTIVLKCLEKEPPLRYSSAAELRDDIGRFRSGEAIHARPIGPLRRAGRFAKRHVFFLLAVATVLLVIGLAWWQVQRERVKAKEVADKVKRDQEEKTRQEQQKELLSSLPEWVRFWWTPERSEDNIPDEDRALFREGFVRPRTLAPDLVNHVDLLLPPSRQLVSPEAKRVFGDLEARIHFRLNAEAAARGVRIGIQSHEGCLPFILGIQSGRLSLVSPADLSIYGNQARPPLRIKAEKRGPELTAGEYRLTLRREGLHLLFSLQTPQAGPPAQLAVWDTGLSHWRFKNIQLAIRDAPEGFQVLDAEILRKSSPQRLDDLSQALSLFHNGEYNGAEAELDAIVGKKGVTEDKDLLKIAQAYYYLGLIQEICHPEGRGEVRYYARSLDVLSQLSPEREKATALTPSFRALEGRLHVRRLVRAFQRGMTGRAEDELARLAALQDALASFPPATPGLGEPFAWELVPLFKTILEHRDKEDCDQALALFKVLGLPTGSAELSRAAAELGLALAAAERADDLIALHKAHPAPSLVPAFILMTQKSLAKGALPAALETLKYAGKAFVEGDARAKLAGAGAELLEKAVRTQNCACAREVLELLPRPALVAALGRALDALPEAPPAKEMKDLAALLKGAAQVADVPANDGAAVFNGLLKTAQKLIAAGRPQEVQTLHEAWPDARLAPAFAQAIRGLAVSADAKAEPDALALLRYARDHDLGRNPELIAAAVFLAQQYAAADEKSGYPHLLGIQRAFPTRELLDRAEQILRGLAEAKKQGAALSFYGSARVVFGPATARLTPIALGVLETLPAAQATRTLADLLRKVGEALQETPPEVHLWQLECADLYLALGQTDRAVELYGEVHAAAATEPEVLPRSTLRLCAWNLYRGHPLPVEMWTPVLNAVDWPEEAKLMARLVTSAVLSVDLDAELRRLNGPSYFTEAEWDVARALQARTGGNQGDAQTLLWQAGRKAAPARGWPNSLIRAPLASKEAN